MSVGWGLGSWGTSPWGFGATALLTIDAVVPVTIRSIKVTLSVNPLARSPLSPGDALNPNTWTVVYGDDDTPLTVYATSVENNYVTLLFLEVLPSFATTITVSSNTLLDSNLNLINYPRSASTRGLALAPVPTQVAKVDLMSRNVQGDTYANSLVIGSGGDYLTEAGTSLLKKLIVRRLISTPGDWAAMPNYGGGLQVKRPLPSRDLLALAALFEQQIELEPDVDAAQVSLSYDPRNGVLIVNYKVQTVEGSVVEGTFPEQQAIAQ